MLVRPLNIARLPIVFLMTIALACTDREPAPSAGPHIRATILTIRTTVRPENRFYDHQLIIAGDKARFLGESDTWRLFDVKARTVTFVDDVTGSYQTESMADIIRKREAASSGALPAGVTRARIDEPGERRTMHNISASLTVIESGAYRRDLWLAGHPAIPQELFAMMYLSEPATSPLAPMMQTVDEALAKVRAFPLLDRTEVPIGSGSLIVERRVIVIAPQAVAQSLLTIPTGYRDATPAPAPPDAGTKTE